VSGEFGDRLVDAATGLLGALRPGDRIALLTFASQVHIRSLLTKDRELVQRAIQRIEPGGRTALRDAVFAGLTLRADATNRALLLVFSDDRDTASWLTSARVVEAARATDVIVYAVSVADLAAWRGDHRRLLEELAMQTGGRVIRIGRRELTGAFHRILGEFRSRYVLSYEPSGVPSHGWHALSVRLRARAGRITARRGYYAGDVP
jgi:VWFA-related protein